MGIFALPNEMLVHISSFLQEESHLAQLVKAHPIFYQLLNRILYQINANNEASMSAVHWAAMHGRLATIHKVRYFGLDINQQDDCNSTPLLQAVINGHVNVVQMLLDTHDVDFSLLQQGHNSALNAAAASGNAEIVRMLLDYDRRVRTERHGSGEKAFTRLIDVNAGDSKFSLPLWSAIEGDHAEVLEVLLGLDDIDAFSPNNEGWPPFIYAAGNSSQEVVDVFLESGKIDPSAASSCGWTPLTRAIIEKRISLARTLLRSGKVDVNVRTHIRIGRDVCPLDLALLRGGEFAAELLSMQGIDVNSKDSTGYTPLHIACEALPDYSVPGGDVAGMLLKAPGMDINARTDDGQTPLSLAISNHKTSIFDLLLNMPGIELNTPTGHEGREVTAIVQAIRQRNSYAFGALLRHPKFDPIMSLTDTPRFLLHDAVRNNDPDMLEFLLSHGEDINENDSNGNTPLSVRTYHDKPFHAVAAKRFLLTREDLDPNLTDDSGINPFLDAIIGPGADDDADMLPDFLAHSRIDPNITRYGYPALSLAILNDSLEKVVMLLDHPRTDVNFKISEGPQCGRTPLHCATDMAYENSVRKNIVLKLLAHKHIDVNIIDSRGESALHLAAQNGLYDIVKILLDSGLVDMDKYGPSGLSPLHLTAHSGP